MPAGSTRLGIDSAMAPDAKTLDDLRREIDEIDDSLHDLLIRRTAVSLDIAKVKAPANGGNRGFAGSMRPGRGAALLRRLLARHRGKLTPSISGSISRTCRSA